MSDDFSTHYGHARQSLLEAFNRAANREFAAAIRAAWAAEASAKQFAEALEKYRAEQDAIRRALQSNDVSIGLTKV